MIRIVAGDVKYQASAALSNSNKTPGKMQHPPRVRAWRHPVGLSCVVFIRTSDNPSELFTPKALWLFVLRALNGRNSCFPKHIPRKRSLIIGCRFSQNLYFRSFSIYMHYHLIHCCYCNNAVSFFQWSWKLIGFYKAKKIEIIRLIKRARQKNASSIFTGIHYCRENILILLI